jgi:hypothetical protein
MEIGRAVEALFDFPSVPKGTRGTVVKLRALSGRRWTVLVEWDVPRPSSVFLAMILDASFNFTKPGEPVCDEFGSSEYQALLRILPPAA